MTIHLTASDATAGVAETWYSLDGAPWVEGTDVLVPALVDHTGDGLHTVVYYSVDAVGNIEAVRMCTALIDTRSDAVGSVLLAATLGAMVFDAAIERHVKAV